MTLFALGFAAGMVVGVVAIIGYSVGVAWWLCKDPEP